MVNYMCILKNMKPKKNKYNSKKTVVDGWTFDSRLEADYYRHLKSTQELYHIKNIFRQVPLLLAQKSKLVVDFMIHYENGDLLFADTKGFMTANASTKIKIAERLYNIKIHIVKRGDF